MSEKSATYTQLRPVLEVYGFDPFLAQSCLFLFAQVQILLERLQLLIIQGLPGQVNPHLELPLQHEVHAVHRCVYNACASYKKRKLTGLTDNGTLLEEPAVLQKFGRIVHLSVRNYLQPLEELPLGLYDLEKMALDFVRGTHFSILFQDLYHRL